MNKKQVLATLALSTIVLAQAGFASADELAPIDSSAPTTEVVTPTAPSASTETETPATQPTEPSVTPVANFLKAKTMQEVLMMYQQSQANLKVKITLKTLMESQLKSQKQQTRQTRKGNPKLEQHLHQLDRLSMM